MKEAPETSYKLTMSIRRDFPSRGGIGRRSRVRCTRPEGQVFRGEQRNTLTRGPSESVCLPGWLETAPGADSILGKNRVGKDEERNDEES